MWILAPARQYFVFIFVLLCHVDASATKCAVLLRLLIKQLLFAFCIDYEQATNVFAKCTVCAKGLPALLPQAIVPDELQEVCVFGRETLFINIGASNGLIVTSL